jgi:hypothetical protein
MKRIPDRDWFTSHAVKAVLEISEGTLYEMVRTGEIWEPTTDRKGRNLWSFDAVADACERQIDRWLDDDIFDALRNYPSRRCRHSADELQSLREWIHKQVMRRRRFQFLSQAVEWQETRTEGDRRLGLLHGMDASNRRQRIGGFFGWLRSEGARAARLVGLVPYGPPRPDGDGQTHAVDPSEGD